MGGVIGSLVGMDDELSTNVSIRNSFVKSTSIHGQSHVGGFIGKIDNANFTASLPANFEKNYVHLSQGSASGSTIAGYRINLVPKVGGFIGDIVSGQGNFDNIYVDFHNSAISGNKSRGFGYDSRW